MASELCMNCFSVKGKYSVCPFCGYEEGTPPKQPHYLIPGTILANHFVVGTAIGAGGFGITYKSYDMTLGVIVAVKEFYPAGLVNRTPGQSKVGLLSGDKKNKYGEQLRRFLLEAQSIARFGKAKDIVNVYDYFEDNNTAYIIMEYVDEDLLKDRLEEGKVNPEEALLIMGRLIEAVKKIHAQGIIHRDISPDNVFISTDNAVKVFDFGAARLSDSSEGTAGEKIIKVGYSAPEQYRESGRQGYFTDIYSLGAIYYQMLTGQKPIESVEREYRDNLESPLELGVPIDANLDRAVMEALAVQPELRFQGIQQFDDAVHGKRIAEYPKIKIKKRKQRRNWVAACSILVIMAVIVGIAMINTVYKKENIMFETNVTKDTITIWVDSQAQKETFESVKEEFSKADPNDSEAIMQMKKENENISVQIRDITKPDEACPVGYEDMDSALKAALDGKEIFPDLFVSDNVSDLGKYELASFENNVYQNINTEDYLYFSAYQKYFPDMKEMPTAFDVLLFYAIDLEKQAAVGEKLKKHKVTSSSLLLSAGRDGTIELADILAANQKEDGKEHTYLDERTAVLISILKNPEGFDNQKGTFVFDGEYADTLHQCLEMRRNTMKDAAWKTSASKNAAVLYGNSVLAGSGHRSMWYRTEAGDIPYQVFVPTVDGKMLVWYGGKLAISARSDKNKQIAGMRFVYFALGQQQCAVDKDTAYPISDVGLQGVSGGQKSAFDEFFMYNNPQKVVRNLVKKKCFPCILLARGSGDITEFSEGIQKKKLSSADGLEEYCKSFAKG